MSGPRDALAFVVGPTSADTWDAPPTPHAAIVGTLAGREIALAGDLAQMVRHAAHLEAGARAHSPADAAAGRSGPPAPRWVWWSARRAARHLVAAGVRPARAWDIREVHGLLAGGEGAEPAQAWAFAHDLGDDGAPAALGGGILDALVTGAGDTESPTLPPARPEGSGEPAGGPRAGDARLGERGVGHLRAEAAAGTWAVTDERLVAWGRTALACAAAQEAKVRAAGPRLLATVHAESAAAMLCEELEHDGLPVDRRVLLEIVEPLSAPPQERDAAVLSLVPGHERTDLRNPAQVKELLAAVGLDLPHTRKWVLEQFRETHPLVPALLEWRRTERIATTYGLRWMAEHVGPDDRLRGRWHTSDGGAGRMTAEAGLHSLPALLRPGVAAEEGFALVRADLGQIEPRVLATVSGDRAFAEATRADDLYAPVGERLGVDRPTAKVAVLAAMYGQRSGAAGKALEGLERAYPTAMRLLDDAYERGRRGLPVRTWGGRLIRTNRGGGVADVGGAVSDVGGGGVEAGVVGGVAVGADPRADAARGRFARNAVVQGAAAELFKAWAATVRWAVRPLGGSIVLCLHDELLVHVPQDRAQEAAAAVDAALADAARRWSGGAPVRFVADTTVLRRWSEAKD